MKILVACEESQRVCIAFRERGHEAYSCDVIDCSGGKPEWHIKDDVRTHLNRRTWDMIIAFPPCTYICRQGQRWFGHPKHPNRLALQQSAIQFFKDIWYAECDKIAIENPVGWMNSHWMKPTQTIQPWQFGHDYSKRTCLWLKNLPPLKPTKIINLSYITTPNGQRFTKGWYEMPRKSLERSKTFPGIALAMANQWG